MGCLGMVVTGEDRTIGYEGVGGGGSGRVRGEARIRYVMIGDDRQEPKTGDIT